MGPKKKPKQAAADTNIEDQAWIHRHNRAYFSNLESEWNAVVNRRPPFFRWSPNPMDITEHQFWSRLKIGSLRCTMNALKNLFVLPTVTDEIMYEASLLWKITLLKPLVESTPHLLSSHCPNLDKDKTKRGQVPLDAAIHYLQKFMRPRMEFRRWHGPLEETTVVYEASRRVTGGKLLPMYILGLNAEAPSVRKHAFHAKNNTAVPIGQSHTISVDLREGRKFIYDDTKKAPIPYTEDAFHSLDSLQHGIFVTKRLFLHD